MLASGAGDLRELRKIVGAGQQPIPYEHPSGAVIWVRLSEQNMGDGYRQLRDAPRAGSS